MKIFQSSPAAEWRPKIAHGETVGFVVKTDQAPERGERFFWRSIFCRPIRGLHLFPTNNPTVLPLATFFRASGALAAVILFLAVGAMAETTNTLSNAEIQGRNLAQQILEQRPVTNFAQSGILKIRDTKGNSTNLFVKCRILVRSTNWYTRYYVSPVKSFATFISLTIVHIDNSTNSYEFYKCDEGDERGDCYTGVDKWIEENTPFANSDFWVCDLGLEFFHWPQQKILPKTTNLKRGREYTLLESTNPNPTTNGYSRVLSWIDKESGGILEAEAYDFNGKLLKDFAPKSFKKVNGQWQLQEMEIRNVQTGSRTRLEFDLKQE